MNSKTRNGRLSRLASGVVLLLVGLAALTVGCTPTNTVQTGEQPTPHALPTSTTNQGSALGPTTEPEPSTEPQPTTESEPTAETEPTKNEGEVLPNAAESEAERDTSPAAAESDIQTLVAGNSAFTWNLYQQLRTQQGNLFYSPYSISQALAMTYAGARGETEQQMAHTLHFDLPQERLHPAFNALDLQLASQREEGDEDERFQLNVANALWGQRDFAFLPDFLDLLAQNYGAGLGLLDFRTNAEGAREIINNWVSEQTEEKIQNLIPEGVLQPDTRLVLTNAIYFTADWAFQFQEESTRDGPFHLADGGQVTVPMMTQTESFRFSENEGVQAIELPYRGGDISFIAVLPPEGGLEAFEENLSLEQTEGILNSLDYQEVVLTMPKFTFESTLGLAETLQAMGMTDAFNNADFSGMTGNRDLAISNVLHKAFVAVDEAGTEAAAATAVVMAETSTMPAEEPVILTLDRPFLFMIRENTTGTILFMGRLIDPS